MHLITFHFHILLKTVVLGGVSSSSCSHGACSVESLNIPPSQMVGRTEKSEVSLNVSSAVLLSSSRWQCRFVVLDAGSHPQTQTRTAGSLSLTSFQLFKPLLWAKPQCFYFGGNTLIDFPCSLAAAVVLNEQLINLANNWTDENVRKLFLQAWRQECKCV